MPRDMYDLEITGAAPATVAALDLFGRAWIGYGTEFQPLLTEAERDRACPLAQAYAAILHMSLEAESGYRAAAPFLKRLDTATVTPRESAIIAAARHWAAGDPRAALTDFARAVEIAPTDLVAAKWGQYLAFNFGDAPAMLSLAERTLPHHRHTPEAWGMHAFALEQSHRLDEAEAAAHRALELKPTEPWAQHALAHVYETQGRLDEGVTFLERAAPGWADRSVFMREHNWWHLALFRLDRDEPARALKIYDDHLWGEWPEFAQEQIGAIALLWRLELRGVDIGNRWQPVVAKVEERGHEHLWPFHDLHYAYARAHGSTADAFLESLRTHAERSPDKVWSKIAHPAAEGLIAHARKNFTEATARLTPLIDDLYLIGGSHAQRDIFIQTWLDAATRSGAHNTIINALKERAAARPTVAIHHRELDAVLKR
ncbi:MAG: tetratricopeptide repeat protein [Alphaproteobacteria bacterium]|nr:tetratricopeptide repeat protein [Alphaproteobacteria bacterium]